jgi:hypothetical protein
MSTTATSGDTITELSSISSTQKSKPESEQETSNNNLESGTNGPRDEEAGIQHAEEGEETEGGRQAWLTVLGSSLVYFASFGIISSFGFFQSYYEDTLVDVPTTTISFVGTLQLTLVNLLAAPAGSLYDRYGLKVCMSPFILLLWIVSLKILVVVIGERPACMRVGYCVDFVISNSLSHVFVKIRK